MESILVSLNGVLLEEVDSFGYLRMGVTANGWVEENELGVGLRVFGTLKGV